MSDIKECLSCHIPKPLSDFYWNRGKPRPECIACTAIRNHRQYETNYDGRIEANKKHKRDNPEYYRNYRQNYYTSNREKLLGRSQNHYATLEGRALTMRGAARRTAAKKNMDFTLSLERVQLGLMIGRCERTGIFFDLTPSKKTWRNPFAPSLDRIDSFKGYTDCNIQLVVTLYNYGKGQHTDDEFIRFCHMVALKNPRKIDA